MPLTLKNRQADDVVVIDLAGRIVLGDGSGVLRDALRGLGDKGRRKILLDLAQVSYIDSAGLGELVAAFVTLTGKGGRLKLLNPTKRVAHVLEITKLDTVFEVYADGASALRSFGSAAASA